MLPVSKRPHVPRRTHQLASSGLLTATWTYFDMTCISRTTWFLEMSQITASSFAWQTDSTTTRTRHLGFANVTMWNRIQVEKLLVPCSVWIRKVWELDALAWTIVCKIDCVMRKICVLESQPFSQSPLRNPCPRLCFCRRVMPHESAKFEG